MAMSVDRKLKMGAHAFNTSFDEGPSEQKRVGSGDVAKSKKLIG